MSFVRKFKQTGVAGKQRNLVILAEENVFSLLVCSRIAIRMYGYVFLYLLTYVIRLEIDHILANSTLRFSYNKRILQTREKRMHTPVLRRKADL